jgi:hypothetical protein
MASLQTGNTSLLISLQVHAVVGRYNETNCDSSRLQVGIVASYVQSDWEADMNLAKAIGIDGFALNIGESGECHIDPRFNSCVLFRKGYLQ